MTGWRLGWITGPHELMQAVMTMNTSASTHVPTFLMPAAETALGLTAEVQAMADSFAARRVLFHEGLQRLPASMPHARRCVLRAGHVTGTGMDDATFADRALEEARVAVIPGSLMAGGEGLIRMSYATDEASITEGMRRLQAYKASEPGSAVSLALLAAFALGWTAGPSSSSRPSPAGAAVLLVDPSVAHRPGKGG